MKISYLVKKRVHYQKPQIRSQSRESSFDAFTAHSPLNISRGKADELKSKIFYDSPQVPNRVAKYFIGVSAFLTIISSFYDKATKKNKLYLREEEKRLFSLILPFNQAMQDLRFTAIEQRNYMVHKAIADQYSPALFSYLRKRFDQEDIFVQDLYYQFRNTGAGNFSFNSSFNPYSFRTIGTMYDKGLFDNREVGYIS